MIRAALAGIVRPFERRHRGRRRINQGMHARALCPACLRRLPLGIHGQGNVQPSRSPGAGAPVLRRPTVWRASAGVNRRDSAV